MQGSKVIIKVCGMRDGDNIRAVERAHPDMMGFICWQGSRRNVTARPSYLPACKRVGVFVDPTAEQVMAAQAMLDLDYMQLHGHETPALCNKLKASVGLPLIKAISVREEADIAQAEAYQEVADLLLFDTKCKSVGGSGMQFDWDMLQGYAGTVPFLLSGGIGPGDWERVRLWTHPRCIGIDINSRFETAPAQKDAEAVNIFIGNIKRQ